MTWMTHKWHVSQNSVFIFPSKTPPFLLIPPFLCHLRMFRMTRNENHNGEISLKSHSSHFHFFQSSFVIQEWWGMTEWCKMIWYSWTKAKPLILKFISFHHHSVIQSQYPIHHIVIPSFLAHSSNISSFGCHSIIPSSFRHYIIIPLSFRHPFIIWMSFHNSSVIPSIIVHVGNILSFGCHFIHSVVIRALEWRGMTFWWNDRNEVRMMISVIQKAFLSFPSSQTSGKNEVFLDFIPVILASFGHLGVIQKFSLKRNDVGMTESFGLKLIRQNRK